MSHDADHERTHLVRGYYCPHAGHEAVLWVLSRPLERPRWMMKCVMAATSRTGPEQDRKTMDTASRLLDPRHDECSQADDHFAGRLRCLAVGTRERVATICANTVNP